MKTANLEGVNLEFETSGNGEPVILIHGSVIADAYIPLMTQRSLAQRYPLVRYRRRGYSGSTHSAPPVSIEDQANDCRALMRSLGIAKAHIVGHSYGGVIAARLAIAAPDMVQSLALLEPAFVWMVPSGRNALPATALEKYQAGDKRDALDSFMSGVSGRSCYRDELERVLPGGFDAAVADVDTFFQVEMPALMEFGESFKQRGFAPNQTAGVGVGRAQQRSLVSRNSRYGSKGDCAGRGAGDSRGGTHAADGESNRGGRGTGGIFRASSCSVKYAIQ